jgi:hypothetical protein
MEMTIEQQRALALANARMRAAEAAAMDPRGGIFGKIDTFMRGAADTLTFGLADELSAGADALFGPVFGTGVPGESFSDRYEKNLARQRAIDRADTEDRFGYRLGGQLGGGVTGGIGLAKSGLSLGANVASRGGSLAQTARASAIEGGLLGGLHGAGSGEGLEGRAQGAVKGGLFGGTVGAVAPYAIAGASTVAKPLVAPIMARLRPDEYADAAIADAVRRSGDATSDQKHSGHRHVPIKWL